MPGSSISSSELARRGADYSPGHDAPAEDRRATRRGTRALLARVALLGAIAALPVAFSAWIDPARLVTSRRDEAEIARAIAVGKMVTGFANFDDRAIERALVRLRPYRADVLAVGSSRLQPLGASPFPGARFVNVAVQGAMLDDLFGVYGLYDDDAHRPKRVVLNVDPWTQSYRAEPGWRSVQPERAALMRRIGVPVSPLRDRVAVATDVAKRLASPEYLRRAVFSFRRYGPAGTRWEIAERPQNERKTKLPDGSVVWGDIPADNGVRAAPRFAANELHTDDRLRNLDARVPGREDALERLVCHLRDTRVEATVLLVPFPPEVYDAFLTLPGYRLDALERDIRALATRCGARVAGSYDPRPLGLTARDFFDETHLRPAPLARLVAESSRARPTAPP